MCWSQKQGWWVNREPNFICCNPQCFAAKYPHTVLVLREKTKFLQSLLVRCVIRKSRYTQAPRKNGTYYLRVWRFLRVSTYERLSFTFKTHLLLAFEVIANIAIDPLLLLVPRYLRLLMHKLKLKCYSLRLRKNFSLSEGRFTFEIRGFCKAFWGQP